MYRGARPMHAHQGPSFPAYAAYYTGRCTDAKRTASRTRATDANGRVDGHSRNVQGTSQRPTGLSRRPPIKSYPDQDVRSSGSMYPTKRGSDPGSAPGNSRNGSLRRSSHSCSRAVLDGSVQQAAHQRSTQRALGSPTHTPYSTRKGGARAPLARRRW